MTALARWCCRRPWWVVAAWVLAVIVLGGISHSVGEAYANSFNLPNTDTQRALDLLKANFPQASGDLDQIVLHTKSGKVTDARYLTSEKAMLAKVGQIPHVIAVISPFGPQGAGEISRDGTTAYAQVQYDELANKLPRHVLEQTITTAQSIRSDYLDVQLGGQGIEFLSQPSTKASEIAGIIGSAIVLFLAFGSWRGMVTPLITAIAAIGVGSSLASLLSQVMTVAPFALQLSILIGLGVGVDYALFIVSRHRNNLLHGMKVEESIAAALNTSGRAVLFAGATVCVALLGMFLLNVGFIFGVALCAAATVALTMLASLTLLPALLHFMGPKVLGRKRLAQLEANGPDDSHVTGGWLRWAQLVERRRAIFSVVALIVVVVLALPFFGMRLGFSDASKDPSSTTTHKAYDLLADGFGAGFNGPLQIVAGFNGTGQAGDLKPLEAALSSTPGIVGVSPPVFALNRKTAVLQAIAATPPESLQTTNLVKHLRSSVIPAAIRGTPVAVTYVGGATAAQIDFSHVVARKLPIFIAVVIVVASLLLMVAFRSLLIPLVASAMNIFAAGATFGVLVFVYQHGHFATLLKTQGPGPIDSFLPVMLFAILFGLSMDYQVFLVSRMHEEWIHTGDNKLSVTVGQAETGRVITAAATIMVVVFLSFVFAGQRQVGEFGLGLASAVFIDAFVIRTVLVPALMHALGNSNWYLPKWLDKILPHVSIEPPEGTYDNDLTLSDF